MSRSIGPSRSWMALGLLVALATVVFWMMCSPARSEARDGRLLAAAANRSKPAAPKGPLPDSVLARVGRAREITAREFRHAWAQVEPPARPDTLTPQAARQFLDLMIGKEALGEEALRESWVWSPEESARVNGLADRMMMTLVLDSVLRVTQAENLAAGHDSLPPTELGTHARDEAIRRLGVTYDDGVLERVARAFAAIPPPPSDSGLFAALRARGRDPQIPEADMGLEIARWSGDPFLVRDLMAYWKRMNPLTRPRIDVAAQVRDMVANAMFEAVLRNRAEAQGYAGHPEIIVEVNKQRELIAVTHLVGREVYEKIPIDSLALTKFYLSHENAWDLPPRVRLVRLLLETREQADRIAEQLVDPVQADSLVARAERAGLSYYAEYSAETDSTIFARGMERGPGYVMGPDSTSRGWAVSRVVAVMPGRARPFSEVKELVRHAMYGEAGERLMQALLDRVRAKTEVRVNETALSKLTAGTREGG